MILPTVTPTVRGSVFSSILSAGGFTGLLDSYPGASVAYSLRALSAGWLAGDVVEVRRSSDGTLQSFTASQILNGGILTFTGAGDGFVSTWYDQSGNGFDVTKATTTEQPKIVSSGALVTKNGVVSILGDGVDDRLYRATASQLVNASDGTWSAFGVAAGDNSSVNSVFFSNDVNTRTAQLLRFNAGDMGVAAISTTPSFFIDGAGVADISAMKQMSGIRRLADVEAYYDGVSNGALATTGTPQSGTAAICIFNRIDGSPSEMAYIAELICYSDDMSADRAAIEAEQKAYYNV